MHRAWLVILLCVLQLASRSVRAEESKVVWQGPACLDSQAVFQARLAALVEPADAMRLSGRVAVTARGGVFEVQLSLALGARALGQRRFEARTCTAVAETAAVAAAMAAFSDDAAPSAAGEPLPDNSSAWAKKRDPEPDFSRASGRPAARPIPAQPRVGLLAFAQVGVLPSPAVGGALELGVGLGRRGSLALQGGISGEQERSHGSERSTFLRLLFGAVRGCFAPFAGGRLRFDTCTGVQLLWIRGHGKGFDIDRSASLTTVAPLLALDLSLRGPRFLEWRVQAEGSLPLSRQRFLVDGREVARAASVTFSARLGPVVRF
ncbi:MAG TPA: hypothetical protein VIW29_21135 [Polyangiaceae bacterium]